MFLKIKKNESMFRNCYKKWLWKIVFENSFLQDPDEHNAKHPSTGEVHVIKLASVSTRGKKIAWT